MSLSADRETATGKRRTEGKGEMEKRQGAKGWACESNFQWQCAQDHCFSERTYHLSNLKAVSWGKWRKIEWRPFIKKWGMVLCRSQRSAALSPWENKYIHMPLFAHLRGGRAAMIKGWFSCYRDNISTDAWRGICGQCTELSPRMKRSPWLSGRMAGRLANRPGQSVSNSELWMYSVEAIDTIVLWGGGWREIKNQQ